MLAVAIAAVAALVAWIVAGVPGGLLLEVEINGAEQSIGPVAVFVSSLLAGLAAWGLLAILERKAKQSRRTWTITAVAVLAVSLVSPLTSAVETVTWVVLWIMHLIVGAVLIFGLRRTTRGD